MSTQNLIHVEDLACSLVWDGTDEVRVPPEMGVPRADQMQGSACERLAELAMRICYDSMGTKNSRSSAEAHAHIQKVKHFDIYEHWQKTMERPFPFDESAFVVLLNRPGLWLQVGSFQSGKPPLRLTMNKRVAIDWNKWCQSDLFKYPELFTGAFEDDKDCVEPVHAEEKWISIFVQMSRGCSHEMVRHRFRTAVSQRSSRFCDESESPWVLHPLLVASGQAGDLIDLGAQCRDLVSDCRGAYATSVSAAQKWLKDRGVEGTQARKQARGAARGFLGNALLTEMIFSASVAQWRRMIVQRASNAADAEIRCIFSQKIIPVLRSSRYGQDFADIELEPASDGIGMVLKGGGQK